MYITIGVPINVDWEFFGTMPIFFSCLLLASIQLHVRDACACCTVRTAQKKKFAKPIFTTKKVEHQRNIELKSPIV